MTVHTEDFDVSNQTGLAGLDLTWLEYFGSGTFKIVSNAAEITNVGGPGNYLARAQHDTGSADMYVSAVVDYGSDTATFLGVATRMNASDGACYTLEVGDFGGTIGIYRYNSSGAYVETLATESPSIPSGTFTLAFQVEGTALRGYIDGTLVISTTNGTITSGQRGGLSGYINASTGDARWLSFEAGALSDLGATINGTGAASLGGLGAAASGVRTAAGAAASTLGGLGAAASGVRTAAGSLAADLGGLGATASGVRTVNGEASALLGALLGQVAAVRTTTGTMTLPLGAIDATATGSATASITGTAAANLGELVAIGSSGVPRLRQPLGTRLASDHHRGTRMLTPHRTTIME